MKNPLEELEYGDIKRIHHMYLNEFQSLTRTANWVNKAFKGIKINRHHLSHIFHSLNLEVRPPNGRPQNHWRDVTSYSSPFGELAAALIEPAWSDIIGWLEDAPDVTRIEYMSACAFVGGPLYQECMGTLLKGVEAFTISTNTLPPGVTFADVAKGKELYERNYHYWVCGRNV